MIRPLDDCSFTSPSHQLCRLGNGVKYTPLGALLFYVLNIFYRLSSPRAQVGRRAIPLRLVFQNMCSHARKCLLGALLILCHFGGFQGQSLPILGPEIRNPIITKVANNSKTVRYREKVTSDHLWEIGLWLSESVAILVMATKIATAK